MDMESSIGALLTSLIGQLPSLLVEMGFAIALLVMLLSRRNTLGRARTPALAGAGLLLALAILSRVVFAAISAFVIAGDLPTERISVMYTVAGTVFQVLGGVAIILLGLAIIRR